MCVPHREKGQCAPTPLKQHSAALVVFVLCCRPAAVLCFSPLGVTFGRDALRPAAFFSFSGTMLRRSKSPTSSVSLPAGSSPSRREYHLPDDDANEAWLALMLLFAGRLRLPHKPSRKKAVRQFLPGPVVETQPAVDVWLQCGPHFRTVSDGDEVPVPRSQLPTSGGERRGWRFLPLRRDAPDGTRFFDVRVGPAGDGGAGSATAVRRGMPVESNWVEVYSLLSPPAFDAVTFIAKNEDDAAVWATQLAMRAAPLSRVWQRAMKGPAVGVDSAAGSSTRPWVGRARALSDAVNKFMDTGAPAAVTGVVTAVMCDEIFNAVTTAGSCAAFVVGALAMVVRVCAAAAAMGDFADDLQGEMRDLLFAWAGCRSTRFVLTCPFPIFFCFFFLLPLLSFFSFAFFMFGLFSSFSHLRSLLFLVHFPLSRFSASPRKNCFVRTPRVVGSAAAAARSPHVAVLARRRPATAAGRGLLWLSTICPRNLTGTDFPSVGGGGHMDASTSPTPLPERARQTHRSCASTPAACGGRSATLAAPTGARHPWLAALSVDGGDAAPPLAALVAGACGRHVTPPADIQTLINSSSSLPPPCALRTAACSAAAP